MQFKAMISQIRHLFGHKYEEAAYSLILLGFLQRIVKGEAKIIRQYAQGRGSACLCLIFNGGRYFLEIMIKGQTSPDDSLRRLAGNLNDGQEKEGWLVIIDPNKKGEWEEKIYYNESKFNKYIIHVFGC
jgi:hypothetical protein